MTEGWMYAAPSLASDRRAKRMALVREHEERSKNSVVEFLRARLDEDESVARKAAIEVEYGEGWTDLSSPTPTGTEWSARDTPYEGIGITTADYDSGWRETAVTAHIERYDPARVLREVAAKLKILEDSEGPYPDYEPEAKHEAEVRIADLAAVYSDHPDFDPEWALE